MGESWFAGVLSAPWAPVAAAYIFGLVTGWLIWSGSRRSTAPAAETDTAADKSRLLENVADEDGSLETDGAAEGKPDNGKPDDGEEADPCPAAMKFGAIESELRHARELLATENGDQELVDEISTLDTALKRANGRLKVLLKSVKKAKPGK